VEDARRREEAWSDGERQTRSWFVAAAQAYQIGTIGPKELVDAVKAYFTARFNHLEAIRAYNTSLAELERAIGSPLLSSDAWAQRCEF
jgi:outer membrane protein TolC